MQYISGVLLVTWLDLFILVASLCLFRSFPRYSLLRISLSVSYHNSIDPPCKNNAFERNAIVTMVFSTHNGKGLRERNKYVVSIVFVDSSRFFVTIKTFSNLQIVAVNTNITSPPQSTPQDSLSSFLSQWQANEEQQLLSTQEETRRLVWRLHVSLSLFTYCQAGD